MLFSWCSSYGSGRQDESCYDWCSVSYCKYCLFLMILFGVLRGCVLGHILFLIHINELNDTTKSKERLYADDTTICLAVFISEDAKLDSSIRLPPTTVQFIIQQTHSEHNYPSKSVPWLPEENIRFQKPALGEIAFKPLLVRHMLEYSSTVSLQQLKY